MSAKQTRFPERMRERRNALGLSQEELAERIGSSKQVISTYETGIRIPKVGMADRIARVLNVSLDYLAGNTDEWVSYPSHSGEPPEVDPMYILNRGAKKMTDDEKERLLKLAKAAFDDVFDDE